MKTYNLTPAEKKRLSEAISRRNPRPATSGGGVLGFYLTFSIFGAILLFVFFRFVVWGA